MYLLGKRISIYSSPPIGNTCRHVSQCLLWLSTCLQLKCKVLYLFFFLFIFFLCVYFFFILFFLLFIFINFFLIFINHIYICIII
ncbi:hypothetical protein BJ944DRAFT_268909 [Cunninghamella echinulata]|nr:hypothetical protein BJ944DRAFT_268909 [Cunninghamella echinulata]